MSDSDALTQFVAGAADVARAKSLLAGSSNADLLRWVGDLAAGQHVAHLDALSRAGFGKEVKKAARKAAYGLKSAGFSGAAVRAPAIDLRAEVVLAELVLISAPGLDGAGWLVCPDIPGGPAFEIDLRNPEALDTVRLVEGLSAGRLRKSADQMGDKAAPARPVLVHADVGVAAITTFETLLRHRAGGVGPAFRVAQTWRDAAVALGADASNGRCAGVDFTAADAAGPGLETLLREPRMGRLTPPRETLQAIEQAFGALMHGDSAIEEADFRAQVAELGRDAADAWIAQPETAAQIADYMAINADVMWALGDHEAAKAALALADQARGWSGPGRQWSLVARAFDGIIDADAAWAHRQAHMRGEAHH